MKDKHVIKNMEYWKKKNNIPGIEALEMAGLTDGRAKSSAFQMATPGSSPNKGWFGNAIKSVGQGLTGKGGLGFLNPGAWALRGIKNTLDNDPTTTNIFGGGGGGPAARGGALGALLNSGGGGGAMPQDPAMAAVPVQTPMVMKSPMKQDEGQGNPMMGEPQSTEQDQPTEELVMVQADSWENPQTGEMVATENLQIDESGFTPVVYELGKHYVMDNEGTKIPVSPDHDSIVPRSVVEGVEPGRAMQEAIAAYKGGGEQTMGGVGETPIEMRSPSKIYSKEDPEKY